jgi:hypothetical protein
MKKKVSTKKKANEKNLESTQSANEIIENLETATDSNQSSDNIAENVDETGTNSETVIEAESFIDRGTNKTEESANNAEHTSENTKKRSDEGNQEVASNTESGEVKTKKERKKREKKVKEPSETEQKEIPFATEDEFARLEAEMSGAAKSTVNAAPTKNKRTKPVEGLITGYIVLYVCDIIFPVIITYVSKRFFKTDVPTRAIKLTSDQWKRLEPIADEAIKGMVVEIKPQYALIILLGLSYFENATIFIQSQKQNEDAKYNKRRTTKSRKNDQSKRNIE